MKSQAFASLILASLSFNAFALPESQPQPLLGELHQSQTEAPQIAPAQPLAENGAERVGGKHEMKDSGQRTGIYQIAEDGAERVGGKHEMKDSRQRTGTYQIAEDGAERLLRMRKA